jgi:hypothetical protein
MHALKKCKDALLSGYLNTTDIRDICSIVPREMKDIPKEEFVLHYVRTSIPKKWFVGKSEISNEYLFSEFGRDIAIQETQYLQEQLLSNCKKRISLDSFSPKELLEQLESNVFKPDFTFFP